MAMVLRADEAVFSRTISSRAGRRFNRPGPQIFWREVTVA
jgi:hypothetical protein